MDVERREPACELPALRLELRATPLQRCLRAVAARHGGDLGQGHTKVTQGEDPPQRGQLGRGVCPIPGRLVDPCRPEHAQGVPCAEHPRGHAGELRELSDTEHARKPTP
jgi:hypothetical protein